MTFSKFALCAVLSAGFASPLISVAHAQDAMMQKDGMMKHDGMKKKHTMKKKDGMMKEDSTMKGGGMQKEETQQ